MKTILLLLLVLFGMTIHLKAQVPQSFDSLSKSLQIEDEGDWVYIHLQTVADKGPRIVRTEVRGPVPYAKNGTENTVVFKYFFIQDIPRSLRSGEPVTVTWKVMKSDWTNWNKDKQLCVLKQNDVGLSQEEIDLIKSQW